MRSLWVLVLSLMAVTAVADEALWERLRQDANMVVLMRNTESGGNRDGANMLVWDASGNCAGESLLTDAGKAHAERIGETFARRGIKPMVISSPMCRCRETARIAFGDYVTDADLRQTAGGDVGRQEAFAAKASALLSLYRGKSPVVFINHRPNIDWLTLELLDVGDLLVGTLSEGGEIAVVGTLRVEP